MLRKRSRTVQKDQNIMQAMPDSASDSCFCKTRSISFFNAPRLFVGFRPKGLSDSDSAKSPTSTLDYRVLSNLANSFVRSPRSPSFDGPRKSWDCNRVGLGIVDSLNDETKPCGKVLRFSESRNILFGSQTRNSNPSFKTDLSDDPSIATPISLPANSGVPLQTQLESHCLELDCTKTVLGSGDAELEPGEFGKIRSCLVDIGTSSLPLTQFMYCNPKSNSEDFPSDTNKSQLGSPPLARGGKNFENFSGSLPVSISSSHGLIGSLSASDMELSEDYTCIISYGPNARTTHIFGDCIISQSPGCTNKQGKLREGSPWLVKCSEDPLTCLSCEFLSFCFSCKKELEEGQDTIYRDEKAFCSHNCSAQVSLIEEETEKPATEPSDSPGSSFHEELFLPGFVIDT